MPLLGLALWSVAVSAGPDLVIDHDLVVNSWEIVTRTFSAGDCEVVDGCVVPGNRTLLRFATQTANIGDQDIVLGAPASNPIYEFNSCRGIYTYHYHSRYRLLAPNGEVVAETLKPGVCLFDQARYVNEPGIPSSPTYTCSNQGLTRGWSDTYSQYFTCQWVDVTDVLDGAYTLRLQSNPLGVLPDDDPDNNFQEIPVFVGDASGVSHRPDGGMVPGAPVRAMRLGSSVQVSYDTSACPAQGYNLYYGMAHAPSSYTYDGAFCALGTDGVELLPLPDPEPGQLLWFVVVGTAGSMEGGHGFSAPFVERPLSGVGACSVTETRSLLGCAP